MIDNALLFDNDLALQRAQNDTALRDRLNKLMKDDIENLIPKIKKAFIEQNWQNLHDALHRIHGACHYTGAVQLPTELRTIMDAIKTKPSHELAIHEEPLLELLAKTADAIPV